jgi:hypothetical protein
MEQSTWTHQQVGDEVKRSVGHVYKWLAGEFVPRDEKLLRQQLETAAGFRVITDPGTLPATPAFLSQLDHDAAALQAALDQLRKTLTAAAAPRSDTAGQAAAVLQGSPPPNDQGGAPTSPETKPHAVIPAPKTLMAVKTAKTATRKDVQHSGPPRPSAMRSSTSRVTTK